MANPAEKEGVMALHIKILDDPSANPRDIRDGTYVDYVNSESDQLEKNGWVVRDIAVRREYHRHADYPKYEMFAVIQYSRPFHYRLKILVIRFFTYISNKLSKFLR